MVSHERYPGDHRSACGRGHHGYSKKRVMEIVIRTHRGREGRGRSRIARTLSCGMEVRMKTLLWARGASALVEGQNISSLVLRQTTSRIWTHRRRTLPRPPAGRSSSARASRYAICWLEPHGSCLARRKVGSFRSVAEPPRMTRWLPKSNSQAGRFPGEPYPRWLPDASPRPAAAHAPALQASGGPAPSFAACSR
jgi:hypothetical protein